MTNTRSFLNRAAIHARRLETQIKRETNSPNMLSFFVRYALLILISPFLFFFFSFFLSSSNEGLALHHFSHDFLFKMETDRRFIFNGLLNIDIPVIFAITHATRMNIFFIVGRKIMAIL